jgi:hypothetical protein
MRQNAIKSHVQSRENQPRKLAYQASLVRSEHEKDECGFAFITYKDAPKYARAKQRPAGSTTPSKAAPHVQTCV